MLDRWLHDRRGTTLEGNWVAGLDFVASTKNDICHEGIQTTPYKLLMYGQVRLWLLWRGWWGCMVAMTRFV